MSVAAVLQGYADRGVFRGLTAAPAAGGRTVYTFTWLMQRPFTLTWDQRRRVLSFKALLPHAGAPMAAAIRQLVAERSTHRVPRHKRLDQRRVTASCRLHRGTLQLALHILAGRDADAVRQLLALVNDIFLELHETCPDYLIAQFGLSAE